MGDQAIVPEGWPDEFDLESAESVIVCALELGASPQCLDVIVELRWAIAQLRAEREHRMARSEEMAREEPR